jgi:multimeric flavodoxin WrbA
MKLSTVTKNVKIIGISSSASWNGSTAYLVREALMAAQAEGAEVEEFHLPAYRIEHCRGCFKCMASGRCPIDDDFNAIKERLIQADGIVIGSPTYGLAPNACMKAFLDRLGMYSVYTSELSNKYVVGISTAGAAGSKKVAQSLTTIVHGFFRRGKVTGVMGAKVGWGKAQDVPGLRTSAEKLGKLLVDDIRSGRKHRFQGVHHVLLNKLFLGRIMRRNVMENREGRMRAVHESLVTRGLIG